MKFTQKVRRSGIVAERIAICKACPNLTKLNFCKLCGCFMPAKVRIPAAECPALLWSAHRADDSDENYIPLKEEQ